MKILPQCLYTPKTTYGTGTKMKLFLEFFYEKGEESRVQWMYAEIPQRIRDTMKTKTLILDHINFPPLILFDFIMLLNKKFSVDMMKS